jgi:hypothetical protein
MYGDSIHIWVPFIHVKGIIIIALIFPEKSTENQLSVNHTQTNNLSTEIHISESYIFHSLKNKGHMYYTDQNERFKILIILIRWLHTIIHNTFQHVYLCWLFHGYEWIRENYFNYFWSICWSSCSMYTSFSTIRIHLHLLCE